jgi:hypothetical protein
MPRTPKQTDGGTDPVNSGRPSSKPENGNGGNMGSVSSDEVARRAYEIYQSRGGEHGLDFDDWLEAEKQLKQTGQQPPPKAAERRKRARATGS